jgi:hypothetical protein
MSTEDDMGIRGEVNGSDLLAAVKLALASRDLTSKERAFDVIAWIMDEHVPTDRGQPKSVDLFIEAIKQTKPTPKIANPNVFTQQPGMSGITFQNPQRLPENMC